MATKNIGSISALNGSAQVRSVDGIIRVVNIGDVINEGDVLTTGLNTSVEIVFNNGEHLNIGSNTEILLDETVFDSITSKSDEAVDQVTELQQLIIDGID